MSPHAPDADHQATALREALHRNALADTRHRAALARRLGVTHTELLAIEHLTLSHELTTGQLAARLQLSPSGATAVIHRHQRARRVTTHRDPHDRRTTTLSLTPAAVSWAADTWSPLATAIDTLADAVPHDHATTSDASCTPPPTPQTTKPTASPTKPRRSPAAHWPSPPRHYGHDPQPLINPRRQTSTSLAARVLHHAAVLTPPRTPSEMPEPANVQTV